MAKLFEEYKRSLKDYSVDETLDFYLFRPFGFIIVKLVQRFPVTPNHLSFLSLITGILSGIFLSRGNTSGFLYGGILYVTARIVDCSDGMLARLKGSGTPLGRIVDGTVDYFCTFFVYLGMAVGMSKAGFVFPVSHWILLLASGICMAIHSRIIDYYRNEFITHALGEKNSTRKNIEWFTEELEKMRRKKGKYLDRILIWLYLGYSDLNIVTKNVKKRYDQKTYYDSNRLLLRLWSMIGSSTHIFIFSLSSIMYKPVIIFIYSIGAANILTLCLLIIQIKINRKILIKTSS